MDHLLNGLSQYEIIIRSVFVTVKQVFQNVKPGPVILLRFLSP